MLLSEEPELQKNVSIADTHCHLDLDDYDEDREQVVERALAFGVKKILNPGVDLPSSRAAIRLAERFPEVYAAVGLHPNEAKKFDQRSLDELRDLAQHPRVVAVGEIGLDYYRDWAPQGLQLHVFRLQLGLAQELGLPVVVHNRQASEDILNELIGWHEKLVAQEARQADRPGVLHSFSAGEAVAHRAMEAGFYIGFTGPVTFKNAKDLQQVVKDLPSDRLLTETDSPYLTPHPYRGRRNEPAFVRLVAEKIAFLQNMPFQTFAQAAWQNAERLFQW